MRRRTWVRFHNRNERLSIDEETGGARCEWKFTSDLHIANVVDALGAVTRRSELSEFRMTKIVRKSQTIRANKRKAKLKAKHRRQRARATS